jgi:dTDP-4-amino-4,6-dideoxygalactose transaminase
VTGELIGGLFGLAVSEPVGQARPLPDFLSNNALLTVNARSAIAILLAHWHPRRVWLPSYLCRALLDSARGAAEVAFYAVDYSLKPADLTWLEEVAAGDVVVVIDYFGFPAPLELVAGARNRGARVLEDASQALLTTGVGSATDAAVFSPRKFVGVPDGGALIMAPGVAAPVASLGPPPEAWWTFAVEAAVRRAAFDAGSGDRGWYDLFRKAEDLAPAGHYAMSGVANELLSTAIDYEEVASSRRANYSRLCAALSGLALFPALPDEVVPLGFPVRLRSRDRVRESLHSLEIFAPTHWAIAPFVPPSFSDSHALSAAILTLPCDQRYDYRDMDRMAAIVVKEEGRA